MFFLKSYIHHFFKLYLERTLKQEYNSQQFQPNERLIEYHFVFQAFLHTSPKTVLDVGTGITALAHLLRTCGFIVTATDNIYDYWQQGMFNRHFYLLNDDIANTQLKEKFDLITCISTLEHIKNFHRAIKNMFSLLNPQGHLVLSFPYNENQYIENVYQLPGAGFGKNVPYICQVFSRNELNGWLEENKARIIQQEYWQIYAGQFHTFGKEIYPARKVEKEQRHQLTCVLIQKTTGTK